MGYFADLLGTTAQYLKVGLTGVRLKNNSGNLAVRNNADGADASVTASTYNASGDVGLVINSDSAGSAADWKITLQRPAAGMTADYTLTLPIDDGSPSQVLQTNGSGVLTWASASSTDACIKTDTTTLAFGDSSPKTLFTLPANAVVHICEVIIDTAFNGTAPTLTVGVNGGSATKYMGSTQNDLKGTAADSYISHPNQIANVSSENLEATYVASTSSTGSARILIHYSVPT